MSALTARAANPMTQIRFDCIHSPTPLRCKVYCDVTDIMQAFCLPLPGIQWTNGRYNSNFDGMPTSSMLRISFNSRPKDKHDHLVPTDRSTRKQLETAG